MAAHEGNGEGASPARSGTLRAFPWKWLLVFLLMALMVVTAGFIFQRMLQRNVKERAQEELAAVADLKANEISKWIEERRRDATVVIESPFFTQAAREFLADPSQAETRYDLLAWMEPRVRNYDYHSIFLLDAAGEAVLTVSKPQEPVGEYARLKAAEAMSSGEVVMSDLHYGDEVDCIHIDLIAPIPAAGALSLPAAGAVLLRIDPYTYLYPFIQSWPAPSDSAETLLVRAEDDEVVFLNELRHREGTALTLRFPANLEDLPAALAVRGFEGVTEGTDYRGVKVLAAVRKVPGTAWYVIAKEDTSEIYAPVATNTWLAVGLTALLVIALGFLMGLLWIRRQSLFYRRQYKLEAERAALAQHYDYLTRYANDIIVLLDRDWRLVEVNERAIQAYGYSRGELIGMSADNLRSPDTREQFADALRRLDEEGSLIHETVHMRKDGTAFPVEISARVIDVEGARFYQQIIRDISERRKAEEALRESEERLRTIADASGDNIMMLDTKHRIQFINRTEQGIDPGLVIGTHLYELADPEEQPRVKAHLDTVVQDVIRQEYETVDHRPDGTDTYYSSVVMPLVFKDEVIGSVVNSRDITERKLMLEHLERLSNTFLELGTDPLDNIKMIVEAGNEILGGSQMHYGRLERGSFFIYSTARRESGFAAVDEPDRLICYKAVTANGEEPLKIEDIAYFGYRSFPPEVGAEGLRSFLGYPVRTDGRTVGFLGVFFREPRVFGGEETDLMGMLSRAITVEEERLAHEEELRNFIDIASHELRHPMTVIKGNAATLSSYMDRMGEAKRKVVLDDINKGVDRLEKLVYQFLDTARIEREKLTPERTEVDLWELLEEAAEEMRRRLPAIGIATRLQGEGCRLNADPERIEQVLVILTENAANFAPEGSTVEVELDSREESEATVSVMDRGPGVPEGDREKIFERFYQVDDEAHRSFGGIGLGLYIAREIVESHGGRIWHEPREGGGSTFRFTLPCL